MQSGLAQTAPSPESESRQLDGAGAPRPWSGMTFANGDSIAIQ